MKTRAFVVALLLSTTLVLASGAVASYFALTRAANALPRTLERARPAPPSRAPDAPRALPASAVMLADDDEDPPPPAPAENEGDRARRIASEGDPDIAKLLEDEDPRVRNAMQAFFAEDSKP